MGSTTTIISAQRQDRLWQFIRDLWEYRELFWTFVERDIKVRYKQTALGVIWVILQPLFLMGAFSLIFGKVARMPTDGLTYSLFYLAALVPWNTFAVAVTQSSLSMESNAHLISKVYFPRIVVPGGVVCGSFVDFTIGWMVLNIVAGLQGHWSYSLLVLSPLLFIIQGCSALGIGLVLAALNAQYRDVKHAMGFLVQVMMLATPVIYPISKMPSSIQPWLFLNPIAIVVSTCRDILKGDCVRWSMLGLAFMMAVVYLVGGVWFFRKREQRLADVL